MSDRSESTTPVVTGTLIPDYYFSGSVSVLFENNREGRVRITPPPPLTSISSHGKNEFRGENRNALVAVLIFAVHSALSRRRGRSAALSLHTIRTFPLNFWSLHVRSARTPLINHRPSSILWSLDKQMRGAGCC